MKIPCKKQYKRWQRSLGMSLVGVLISIAFSFIILAAALYGYQFIKIQYIKQRESFTKQDLQRILFQNLVQDLRSSGYRGSRTKDDSFPIHYQFTTKIHWSSLPVDRRMVFGLIVNLNNCLIHLPETLCRRALEEKEQAEILIIYHIPQNRQTLAKDRVDPLDTLETADKNTIRAKSLVLIEDGLQGDLFIANEVKEKLIFHQATKDGNWSGVLSKAYLKGSSITELQSVAYYVGKSKQKGVTALFRDDLFHKAEEIFTEISELKIQYGVHLTGKPKLVYKAATQIEDWEAIKSVQVKIKARNQRTAEEYPWEVEVALRNGNGSYFSNNSVGS